MFRRIIGVAAVLLTLGAVAGLWAYFEYAAPVVPGTIVDKQERLAGGDRHASAGRYLSTRFALQNETAEDRYLHGSPHVSDVLVDQQTYDGHAVGDAVKVRYLPINPETARLDGQPVLPPAFWMFAAAAVLLVVSLLFTRTRVAALLAALLGASVLVSRPGPVPALVVLAGSVALVAVVLVAVALKRGVAFVVPLWGIAMLAFVGWTEIRAGAGPTTTTMGQVRSVNVFQTPQSTSRRTLITLQAFDRVHVSYAPAGSTSPSFALDFVDHGSAGNLAEGSPVAIEYSVADPHRARLAQGARSHYWKNAVIPVVAVIGMIWLVRGSRKPKAPRRSRSTPATPA